MPRIVSSRAVLADVADDCGISHDLRLLAVVGVIESFLMLCPSNVFELLHASRVDLAPGPIGQCATV